MDDETLISEARCENCKFCYFAKDDDGSWLMCESEEAKEFVKKPHRNFGCRFFEKR